jgi:microcystin-dependent protein
MKRQIAIAILASTLGLVGIRGASAQDVQQYIGEVRLLAFNWCPTGGWAPTAGALLPIAQNSALFSLLGTSFGGNGVQNFALPNLSGRAPYGQAANGQGQPFGATYGQTQVTLVVSNLPSHTHQLYASSAPETVPSPNGALLPTYPSGKFYAASGSPANTPMAAAAVGMTGGNQPIGTQSPALSMNWCIATQGIYPTRQ